MEKRINVAELLRNCPQGVELDCPMFEGIEFDHIDKNNEPYPIICRVKSSYGGYDTHTFTEYGCYQTEKYSKCTIFPKGKTTWEGFQRPFKDGDILIDKDSFKICIYKGRMCFNPDHADYYCGYRKSDNRFITKTERNGHFGLIEELHHATEKEKEILFKAIENNGYKWNSEAKTLEKLPKFKVGDRIKQKRDLIYGIVTDINTGFYKVEFTGDCGISYVNIKFQDDWELITNKFDINTLVPFESRVLVRDLDTEKWKSNFWGFYDIDEMDYPYECCGNSFAQCIPYEGNEHLLGTTNDCAEFYKTWE